MQIEIKEANAPWVMFETRSIEDRSATLAAGHYVGRDVDFAIITPPGSKDQIERVASEWFEAKEQDVKENRFPGEWLRAYKLIYKEWKEGRDAPTFGTPIRTWPPISPSMRDTCISIKVMTVEQLADANEEVLGRLGMGGRALKQMAIDYLKASAGPGKLASEMSELRQRMASMEGQLKQALEQNQALRAQVAANQPPQASPAAPSLNVTANELLDDDVEEAPRARKL